MSHIYITKTVFVVKMLFSKSKYILRKIVVNNVQLCCKVYLLRKRAAMLNRIVSIYLQYLNIIICIIRCTEHDLTTSKSNHTFFNIIFP